MGSFRGAQPAGDVTARVRPLVRVFFGAATVVALLLVVESSRPYELVTAPLRLVPVFVLALLFVLASRPSEPSQAGGWGSPDDGPEPSGDRSPHGGSGPTLEGAVALQVPPEDHHLAAVGVDVEDEPTGGWASRSKWPDR